MRHFQYADCSCQNFGWIPRNRMKGRIRQFAETLRFFAMRICLALLAPPAFSDGMPFEEEELPIFADCPLPCGGEKSQKGELRLDFRESESRGGEAAMQQRIDQGARWPNTVAQNLKQAAPKFWSLRPLVLPTVPEPPSEWASWVKNPIDAFVFHRLAAKQLAPSPEAARPILIRRLAYDLLGLPPTPEQIRQFVNDPHPLAYERLVEKFLASPQYGERWARHWLDLVHFGETHGYDKDKPRPNAWPYRDYVIRALNDDRPYSRFVREQLAGDALYPGTLDGLAATGFLAAGPWDWIGHAEVSEDKVDGKVARNLDRDDMVTTTMNAFTSLTVQCARCHDHKFDPVNMREYYGLQAVFAALDRSEAEFDPNPETRRLRAELRGQIQSLDQRQKEYRTRIQKLGGARLAAIEKEIQELETPGKAHPAYGYHSEIADRDDVEKWVQIDLGSAVAAERLEYIPAYDDYNGIGAGFGFPVRYQIEVSEHPVFDGRAITIADYTGADVANPRVRRQRILLSKKPVRIVRVTATKLAPRNKDYIFALAELAIFDRNGKNVARSKVVTAKDSIESGVRWAKRNLVDGVFPGIQRDAEARKTRLAAARKERAVLLEEQIPQKLRQQIAATKAALEEARQSLGDLPPPMKMYVGRVHTGQGAFRGTGANGGKPREIRILHRGDVTRPGEVASPRAVNIFEGGERFFNLPPEHHESQRRIALADWILDSENPLTWRSIVNRIWQHHFGRGIVDSPNDFGHMGQRPTHPDLLDWLAVQFRDGGQSIKAMHRWILCSATYRQRSTTQPKAAAVDKENRFLWRMNRRRLDAESIRDSALFLANLLNEEIYGPSFQDFVIEKPEHSPHYQYHLHDPLDARSHRRSIYRFIVRSQQQPFMTALDCADPSIMVGKRAETLTPLQALALLNNRFITAMAEQMAGPIRGKGEELRKDLENLFHRAIGRLPQQKELDELAQYAQQHGTANACRIILNLNEFLYID